MKDVGLKIFSFVIAPFLLVVQAVSFAIQLLWLIWIIIDLTVTVLRNNQSKIKKQLKVQYADKFKVESTKKQFGGVFIPVYEGEIVTLSDQHGLDFGVFWKDGDFGDVEQAYLDRQSAISTTKDPA
jgi:hypothetical protein